MKGYAPQEIHSAVERFYNEVPDVTNIRDIFERFDDYARGVGKLHRRNRFDDPAGWYERDGHTYRVLVAGGLFELDVAAAYAAAKSLLGDVDATLFPALEVRTYVRYGADMPDLPTSWEVEYQRRSVAMLTTGQPTRAKPRG